jgi:predicted P-loop ATPase
VKCGKIDLEKLRTDRDQLWAEAKVRFHKDEPWWFDTPELNKLATTEQDNRYQGGQWDEVIEKFLECPTQRKEMVSVEKGEAFYRNVEPWDSSQGEVTTDDVLLHAIGKPVDRWTQADRNAVAKCLTHNKWKRVSVRDGQTVRKAYRRSVDGMR